MEVSEIITPHDELIQLVKDGQFFTFCVAFALNKGYRNAIKEKKEVKFSVGDYNVEFKAKEMCFMLINKIYIFRVICASIGESMFTGFTEEEVINDLLIELKKEK